MASEKKPCWNCGQPVGEDDVVCENCGMGLLIEEETKETSALDELDALLDGADDLSIESIDQELDSILEETEEDFDIEEFLIETPSETENVEEDQGQQIPETAETQEFRVVERNLPEMLENISNVKEEQMEESEVFVAEPERPAISIPEIPTFDDFQELEVQEVTVEHEKVRSETGRTRKILVSLLSQYFYWSFVFILLGVLSIDLNDPNVVIPDILPLYRLGFNVVTVSPHLYFGVGVFYPMGWFFRYKLKQWNSTATVGKGLLFLIGQIIFHSILIYALLLLNPGVVFSLYLIASWFSMIVSIFVGGLLTFFFGYRFLFDPIYELTPASNLEELEAVS